MVVQMTSFVARRYGYKILQIAAFLGREKSTIHGAINQAKDLSDIYPEIRDSIIKIVEEIAYDHTHTCHGYIARSSTGLLVISSKKPERCAGYWVAEGSKPYINQKAFPQINWSSEPVKVKIKITIEDEEV